MDNKYLTRQHMSGVQTILPAHFDLSQQGPQEGTDDFSLSVESDMVVNCRANVSYKCDNCENMRHTSSDPHIIQSPCSFKFVCKIVKNQKHNAYYNSRGDYYPNVLSYVHVSRAGQTFGYMIRCWKRDFPD